MPRSDPPTDEAKVLKVRVPKELHDRLHVARILQGRPMAQIVEEAITVYLDEHAPPVETDELVRAAEAHA